MLNEALAEGKRVAGGGRKSDTRNCIIYSPYISRLREIRFLEGVSRLGFVMGMD